MHGRACYCDTCFGCGEAGGQPVGRFGSQAEGQGRLVKPVGIDVGSDGTVYVSDSQTCRVLAFGPQR